MVPFPLTDHIRRRSFWFIALVIIIANVWVFFFELARGPSINRLVFVFGIVFGGGNFSHRLMPLG